MQLATFGGGCFWGVEALFREQAGVIEAFSGYEGGDNNAITYQEVCTGTTGHAEVVQVTFDENVVSYQQLLVIFFGNHNPTQLNQQGVDVGTQYRSAVFFHNEEQQTLANQTITTLAEQKHFGERTIVTQVSPAATFHKAEEYHQKYYAKNGGSCSF
jgi:peptide-methionine (S)-S-oxide reductase